MFLRFYRPHPLLAGIVNNIMIYEHHYDASMLPPVNLFPAIAEYSLYFYPRDPLHVHRSNNTPIYSAPPAIFVGPQVAPVHLSLGKNHIVIRLGFSSGCLHRLLHIPMHEIVDYTCNAADFFKLQIDDVNDKLRETDDFILMKDIVEEFLLSRVPKMKSKEPVDQAIETMIRSGGSNSIEYFARESCLSLRHFERKCKDRIGLSPKLFSRIIRFSRAYRMRELDPQLSWTSIAHSAGYFDQMHMIRDFKIFAGDLPSKIDKKLWEHSDRLQADLHL